MTKIKVALAALLVASTASVAMAENEFDPNPANRYPAYAAPGAQVPGAFRSAPVRLQQGRNIQSDWTGNGGGWVPPPAHAGGVG
jgi:hypothetical protein